MPPTIDHVAYLTPQEVVARYRGVISLRTLANWRARREGPPWTKIGGRVLYELEAVVAWERTRQFLVKALAAGFALGWTCQCIFEIWVYGCELY